MRIAVWQDLPSGGGERALYDHVSGLVAHGHYVESWCLRRPTRISFRSLISCWNTSSLSTRSNAVAGEISQRVCQKENAAAKFVSLDTALCGGCPACSSRRAVATYGLVRRTAGPAPGSPTRACTS